MTTITLTITGAYEGTVDASYTTVLTSDDIHIQVCLYLPELEVANLMNNEFLYLSGIPPEITPSSNLTFNILTYDYEGEDPVKNPSYIIIKNNNTAGMCSQGRPFQNATIGWVGCMLTWFV